MMQTCILRGPRAWLGRLELILDEIMKCCMKHLNYTINSETISSVQAVRYRPAKNNKQEQQNNMVRYLLTKENNTRNEATRSGTG